MLPSLIYVRFHTLETFSSDSFFHKVDVFLHQQLCWNVKVVFAALEWVSSSVISHKLGLNETRQTGKIAFWWERRIARFHETSRLSVSLKAFLSTCLTFSQNLRAHADSSAFLCGCCFFLCLKAYITTAGTKCHDPDFWVSAKDMKSKVPVPAVRWLFCLLHFLP